MSLPMRAALAAAVAALLACAACGPSGPSGTIVERTRWYDTLQQLEADSTLIVSGTVTESEELSDASPLTLARLEVEAVYVPKPLGTTADTAELLAAGAEVGESIAVAQHGYADYDMLPAPIMEAGSEYLLFLSGPTPVRQQGVSADVYWVLEASAGLYLGTPSGSGRYVRSDPGSADRIPPEITRADLQ